MALELITIKEASEWQHYILKKILQFQIFHI